MKKATIQCMEDDLIFLGDCSMECALLMNTIWHDKLLPVLLFASSTSTIVVLLVRDT